MEHLHLAIDTSTSRPVAAVLTGERCLHEWTGPEALRHHETLLAGVDECIRGAGIKLSDLAYLSVGVGPGMFTGLRIGVTTAKFLADPLGISCVPVSSLVALACQAGLGSGKKVWALNDAKSRRVYAYGALEPAPDFSPAADEELALVPEEAAAKIQPGDLLAGEGAELFRDFWPQGVEYATDHVLRACSIGKIGSRRYKLGLSCTPLELLPKYLKTGQSHL